MVHLHKKGDERCWRTASIKTGIKTGEGGGEGLQGGAWTSFAGAKTPPLISDAGPLRGLYLISKTSLNMLKWGFLEIQN